MQPMTDNKPFSYAEFKKIYSKVPRLSVDVIVKNSQGIALALRSILPNRNQWHIPGSTVLYEEDVVTTARRVAREELHVSIRTPKFLGYIEYNEEPQRGFGRSVSLVFLAELKSGKIAPDEDASQAAFFDCLPKNIIPAQKTFLKKHWGEIVEG
jgi:ADP-ribose pyrophosphatase YjhB (NUDIX family)